MQRTGHESVELESHRLCCVDVMVIHRIPHTRLRHSSRSTSSSHLLMRRVLFLKRLIPLPSEKTWRCMHCHHHEMSVLRQSTDRMANEAHTSSPAFPRILSESLMDTGPVTAQLRDACKRRGKTCGEGVCNAMSLFLHCPALMVSHPPVRASMMIDGTHHAPDLAP